MLLFLYQYNIMSTAIVVIHRRAKHDNITRVVYIGRQINVIFLFIRAGC